MCSSDLAVPGTPNMNSSMPSRSALETATTPNVVGTTAPDGSTLPAGITVAPVQPGVSPISGLPTADIPSVSPGTAPIGPDGRATTGGTTTAATAPGASISTGVTPQAPTNTAGTIGSTADAPAAAAQIGIGTTSIVPTPPPAANPEVTPSATANESGRVWVGGHYSWNGSQWTWTDGSWQRPPNQNATWVPGQYDATSKQWTEGHWGLGTSSATPRTEP